MKATDNLEAWEALAVTARTGSLSRTAILLDMDLTKVSRLLRELEKEIGFVLFDKTRRPITPTPKCAELVKTITPLVAGFRDLDIGKRNGDNDKLTIRFSAPIELSRLFFSEALLRYSSEHDNVQFAILPEVYPDEVRDGDVDAAVVNRLPTDDTGLVVRQYNCSSTPVFATPEYLEKHGLPTTPEELANHTGLLQKTVNHDPTSTLFHPDGSKAAINWKTTFMTHDQMSLKQLLLSHMGITVDLYAGHVVEEVQNGSIVPILQGWEREPWTMSLVTRIEDERNSPRLRAFAEWFTLTAGAKMRELSHKAYLIAAAAFESRRRSKQIR